MASRCADGLRRAIATTRRHGRQTSGLPHNQLRGTGAIGDDAEGPTAPVTRQSLIKAHGLDTSRQLDGLVMAKFKIERVSSLARIRGDLAN